MHAQSAGPTTAGHVVDAESNGKPDTAAQERPQDPETNHTESKSGNEGSKEVGQTAQSEQKDAEGLPTHANSSEGHKRPARRIFTRKFDLKAVHFIQHLTSLNFATFSNITWKLLEKRWKEKYSKKSLCKRIEKITLIMAANFLMLCASYCTGVFIALAPQFEWEFWDNGTLEQDEGWANIDVNEGIGLLQSSGQAMAAVFGVVTGCVVTAAKGTLKGRILIVNVCTGVYNIAVIAGMMLAQEYWVYYAAYIAFMAGHGVVSAIALPTQLLIASSSKQLVVQGLTVISKYAGMILGMAMTALLYEKRYENVALSGADVGGWSGLVECMQNLTDEVRAEVGTTDLWACMDYRMRAYFPAGVLAVVTLILFLVNPRVYKHMCSTKWCGSSLNSNKRFENQFYNVESQTFGKSAQDLKKLLRPAKRAQVVPAANVQSTADTADKALTIVDLETLSEEDSLRLFYDQIFGAQSLYRRMSKEFENSIQLKAMPASASAAYRLHVLCKSLGVQSTFAQAEKMAAYFDPDRDARVTFDEFLEGFRRIRNTSSSHDAAVVMANACGRVWKTPDFVLLTAMSAIALLPMHGLLIFSIIYQIEIFGSDDDYDHFLLSNWTDEDDGYANAVSTSTIQYVTASTSFLSLLIGIGIIFLIVFEKCVNGVGRKLPCNGGTHGALDKDRVMNRGSMIYVSVLALLNSACMLGAWYLDSDVWAFWVLQMLLMSLLLTLYTTIRAMIIDSVKPQDFSLALSQSSLISSLAGATPAALIWGAIADSDMGASGAWLIFSFAPLLILPLSVTLSIRLSPTYGFSVWHCNQFYGDFDTTCVLDCHASHSRYVQQRAAQDQALRIMAQVRLVTSFVPSARIE